MVFESIVVELVNRYLGTFVENLDSSQLKIGLWGGDVVLKELNLKESALDDLDLPVKIKAGHIGKLTLKIPWKSLYTEPVVAQIEGIYALAVPNVGIKYNEAKAQKAEQDAKQAMLAKIEEQKKWEAEKDKPRDPKQDSFIEKLATQVIKNLQIKVTSIHVRYEDKYTNPLRPFAIGVTLQELLFQTTDQNWKETVIKEAVTQIYKLIRLDSASVYWNSKADLYQDKDKKVILTALMENIPKQGHKPVLQYLFKPISAVAHLRLNTKPEQQDFSIPKIFLTLVFDEIALALSKDQYDDVLEMLESLERMNLLAKYKKTRPEVPYCGHAKNWWHHAYACTLEHTVQRRRAMWNWNNMKKHREKVKQYKEIYTQKLDGKKMGSKDQELIKNMEKDLDVFNISMCRNWAEMDAARLGRKRADEKSQSSGWFGGWFGGGKKKKKEKEESKGEVDDIGNKFQEEFTADEKAKLYKAIGYDENAKDPTFPQEFVAVRLVTKLNKLSVSLMDSKKQDNQLLKMVLSEICASFGQRPSASAIRLDVKVDRLRVLGSPRKDFVPKMVSSVGVSKEENTSLLTIMVETNPMDGECDSRIRVKSRPLEIIYDAITVNGMADFFKPPESVRLKQLSSAAMAKYDEIKEQTTAGVLHMMGERKYADIEVDLMPSYVIVPETGELKQEVNMLLLNLGSLSIHSEKTQALTQGVQYSPAELAQYAYDKFNIKLDNVQLLFVQPGDSWQDEAKSAHSPLYILRPLSLHLLLEKCVFAHDPNLALIRVSGELPLVAVTVSDNRLLAIMKLAASIPLPEPGPEPKEEVIEEPEVSRAASLGVMNFRSNMGKEKLKVTTEYTNLTQMALTFEIKEITVDIRETKGGEETPFLKLIVSRVGVNMKGRTFDLAVDAYLGAIYLQHLQYKVTSGIQEQLKKCEVITGEIVNIINSPTVGGNGEPLLSVSFLQADRKGPEFKTTYNNIAQSITVQFSALDVVLHQGVILSLMQFAQKFEQPAASTQATPSVSKSRRTSSVSVSSVNKLASRQAEAKSSKSQSDILLMNLRALIDNIQLSICNENCVIMHSKVEGIEVGVTMYKEKMGVSALMRKIELVDPDPKSLHPKIFSVAGSEMLKFEMTQYKGGTSGRLFDDVKNVDMDISLQLGRARIVFLNKFVMSLVYFLDNFSVAKAKLDEASQAMKEASKDVAKNLQEKAPRIKLDVKVKAPLVVVPLSSKNLEVMMVNLGDISVQNKFEDIGKGQTRVPGQAHIAERMMVMLTNLQFSRGVLQNDGSIKAEILILDPMTFRVDISRNLSTAFFHGIPDVEVAGVLESIAVKVGQEDVKFAMQLIVENIEERNPDGPKPPQSTMIIPTDPGTSPARSRDEGGAILAGTEIATSHQGKTRLPDLEEEVHSTLKVNFKLMSVSVELYRGLVNLNQGTIHRNPERMLSSLGLKMLGIDLQMNSDTSMSAKVVLHDFTMDDCRSEKATGITRLIRRTAYKTQARRPGPSVSQTEEDEDNLVVNLVFDQNSTEDKIVNLHICSLHICVCAEFLMKVAEFFTSALPAKEFEEDETPVAVKAQAIREKKQDGEVSLQKSSSTVAERGSLDLTVRLDKPEIYLIEDQMNPHTDSLIVDVELNFRLRQTPDVLSVNGEIKGLSLVSCIFGKPDARSSVLVPVDITIIGSGPQGKDHHVDVSMTDFIMTITPGTIRLLTAIAAGVSAPSTEEVIPPKMKDFSNIWTKKKLSEMQFWFTSAVVDMGSSVDQAEVATDLVDSAVARGEMTKRAEKLIISAPTFVLKLEGGVGHRTVPLLIVESSFSAQIHNWSSDLYIESSLGVEIAYNNEKIGVWEPILEPVIETTKSAPHKWELSLEVIKSAEPDMLDEENPSILPPPKMVINIMATEPLQLLVTKTCLDILSQLGKCFNEAYQLQEMEGTLGLKIIPYAFKNETGKELSLKVDQTLELAPDSEHVILDNFQSGKEALMNVKVKKALMSQTSIIRTTQHIEGKKISFMMKDDKKRHEVGIKQARKRMFPTGNQHVVVNTEAHIGQKVISFVSLLQVKNHLQIPMEVMYHDSSGMLPAGVVYPDQVMPVPLAAVYCSTGEIFFIPKTMDGSSYLMSKECVKWKTLDNSTKVKQISCEARNKGFSSYYFNMLPKFEKIYHENTEDLTDQMITLHLHPTVILHNLLPFEVTYTLENLEDLKKDTGVWETLEAGHNVPLSHASVNHTNMELQITNYNGFQWRGKKMIRLDVPELSVWTFEAQDNGKSIYMDLGLHSKEKQGSFDVTVYSPYWIINLTEQDLALKEDDKEAPLIHQKDNKGIMLYFFRDKPMFGGSTKRKESTSEKKKEKVKEVKKPGKVMLKIADADWSDKFSLDTVGSSGTVTCKNKAAGNQMEVGVKIALASSGLTKIVTFTPYYLLLNASTVPVGVKEQNSQESWTQIEPGECKGYYPKSTAKEMKIVATVIGSDRTTVPFFLNKAHATLLRLNDSYGGINAECQVSDSAMITTFNLYKAGMATAYFVNHTSQCTVTIKQTGQTSETVQLDPQTAQLFTWTDPTTTREVLWTCGNKKDMKSALDQDVLEEFFAQDDVKVYFVSFLDGMQRIMMFTQDLALATVAQEAGELEQADQEINMQIHDMGFALINNEKMVELAYMGITSSGVIWEEQKKKRFKAMKMKDMAILEHAYQKHLVELQAGKKNRNSVTTLENKFEVDFEAMQMFKPRACRIRRSFEDGIWMQMRSSPHSMQFHAKINRLQFDDQLRHAVFPVIMSPLPPPKSVAADSVPKPFVEISLMTRIHEHSSLVQVKYFKVLIQEMNLKVDQGFLNEILAMFASDVDTLREQEVADFKTDVQSTQIGLKEEMGVSIKAHRVSFYDYFHISPIKIHVSFSLQGGSMSDTPQANIMGVFLQSVGVVLTDVQDVVFKLGYFERNHSFYNNAQLTSEFIRHYSGQAVKQMYVLVLGLDVLGNPFGLLRGLSEGIEDLFYEPYQGAIQGPEEFAEGLALGVRSLFGHAVGGAAGAVSRITGTLGKGLAALTLDDDYQKKRREQLNKRPATAREGFARGGKGLVMGVFDGVTGIVRKPVEGAKQEGVAGFFKGVGKGLVGVVTRPTSGVVDFASSSLEGIRRITDFSEEVHRLRPPRRFNRDGVIRPYIREEAEGYNLLLETDKGKYVETDEYVTHAKVKEDGKMVFIVTDKRVMLAKRGEIFGAWDTEWMFTFPEMKAPPKQTAKGIEILLKEKEKKKLFGSNVTKKEVPIADSTLISSILEKINEAMEAQSVESGV